MPSAAQHKYIGARLVYTDLAHCKGLEHPGLRDLIQLTHDLLHKKGHILHAADCDIDMLHVACLGWRSSQRLCLIGPQHTVTQLRSKFKGLRRPQHGGSSENVLLVRRSFVVTSAQQQ